LKDSTLCQWGSAKIKLQEGEISRTEQICVLSQYRRSLLFNDGVGSFASAFLAHFNVPAAGATTCKAQLYSERENGEGTTNPHQCIHCCPNLCSYVNLGMRLQDVPHNNEHHGRNDSGCRNEQGSKKGEDSDDHSKPSTKYRQRGHEYQQERKASSSKEQGKHPMRSNLDDVEDRRKFGR